MEGYEIEIEELDDMLDLLVEDEDKTFFVGQINAFTESMVTKFVEVSHRTLYEGTELIVRYLEPVGDSRLPITSSDAEAKKMMKELEDKVGKRKDELVKYIRSKNFSAFKGTWKLCE